MNNCPACKSEQRALQAMYSNWHPPAHTCEQTGNSDPNPRLKALEQRVTKLEQQANQQTTKHIRRRLKRK